MGDSYEFQHQGLSVYRKMSARLNGTGEVIKPSRGKIHGWSLFNKCGSRKYVKFYDKATAPTSSDTPKITIPNEFADKADRQYFPEGLEFSNGIGIRTTDGSADADTADPGDCLTVNIWYS